MGREKRDCEIALDTSRVELQQTKRSDVTLSFHVGHVTTCTVGSYKQHSLLICDPLQDAVASLKDMLCRRLARTRKNVGKLYHMSRRFRVRCRQITNLEEEVKTFVSFRESLLEVGGVAVLRACR